MRRIGLLRGEVAVTMVNDKDCGVADEAIGTRERVKESPVRR